MKLKETITGLEFKISFLQIKVQVDYISIAESAIG